MKKLDLLVIVLVCFGSLLPLLALAGAQTATVEVLVHGRIVYSGPIGRDALIELPGGHNTVRVEDGAAYMAHADCPDGLCVQQGAASALRPLVCLPNGVVVRLAGETEDLDALTY